MARKNSNSSASRRRCVHGPCRHFRAAQLYPLGDREGPKATYRQIFCSYCLKQPEVASRSAPKSYARLSLHSVSWTHRSSTIREYETRDQPRRTYDTPAYGAAWGQAETGRITSPSIMDFQVSVPVFRASSAAVAPRGTVYPGGGTIKITLNLNVGQAIQRRAQSTMLVAVQTSLRAHGHARNSNPSARRERAGRTCRNVVRRVGMRMAGCGGLLRKCTRAGGADLVGGRGGAPRLPGRLSYQVPASNHTKRLESTTRSPAHG